MRDVRPLFVLAVVVVVLAVMGGCSTGSGDVGSISTKTMPRQASSSVPMEGTATSVPAPTTSIEVAAVDWGIERHPATVYTIRTIVDIRPLTPQDVAATSGRLIWDEWETTVDLCNIGLRDEGTDGFVLIGDIYESWEGCGEEPLAMQRAFENFGLPNTACIAVTATDGRTFEHCAPFAESEDRPAGTVFSWGDDLSKWVTEAEMTSALSAVAAQSAFEDPGSRAVMLDHSPGDSDWTWEAGDWSVIIHGHDSGRPTSTDPRLPQGVTYLPEWGFGHGGYVFAAPNSSELFAIHLRPAVTGFGFPSESQSETFRDMVFALAAMMLQEIGWTD